MEKGGVATPPLRSNGQSGQFGKPPDFYGEKLAGVVHHQLGGILLRGVQFAEK